MVFASEMNAANERTIFFVLRLFNSSATIIINGCVKKIKERV